MGLKLLERWVSKLRRLYTQVSKMVTGIKNSMRAVLGLMISNTLNAKVRLWPKVKAVTSTNGCFHRCHSYTPQRASKNKIWSYPFQSAMCSRPVVNQSVKSFTNRNFVAMTRGNTTVFLAFFLLLAGFCGRACAHPFYVSVAEIRMDTRAQTLNLSCRLFTTDLEDALTRLYARPFDLQNNLDDKTTQAVLDEYVQKRFSIGIAGVLQKLRFLGLELEDDATWCYWESSNFAGLGSLTVTNGLLYDFLPDQVNVIHVYADDVRQSTRLVNPERTAGFVF